MKFQFLLVVLLILTKDLCSQRSLWFSSTIEFEQIIKEFVNEEVIIENVHIMLLLYAYDVVFFENTLENAQKFVGLLLFRKTFVCILV